MKKTLGYILSIIGILGLTHSLVIEARTLSVSFLPFLSKINDTALLITSILIVLLGIFLISRSPNSRIKRCKGSEVPIYQGREVVGYRRH